MLFLFSLNSEEQIKIGNETKDYNLSKLPQTTSEGQDIKRLEGDKQLVIELNINKNGISVSGVTIQGWETFRPPFGKGTFWKDSSSPI